MKVVTFFAGDLPPYAQLMMTSVREQMPGVDLAFVAGETELWMRDRIHAICELADDELLSLDLDVIVRRDVREVFDHDFDVAMHARTDKRHRYNSGVIFSRSKAFWNDCKSVVESLPIAQQKWGGDQLAVNLVAPDYRVYDLPERYNARPGDADASIVHYKGPLKKWMR